MKKSAFFLAILLHAPIYSQEIDFPNLTTDYLNGAEEYLDIYGSFADSFSRHYGRAMAFTNHLTYPVGKDKMGRFPSVYAGIGLGTTFANTTAIKNESDPTVTEDALPSILPTFGLSFNAGVGLTKKWDIRMSVVPLIDVNLPEFSGSDIDTSFSYGLLKTKATYHAVPGGIFRPGFSVSPYLTYSTGSLKIRKENLASTSHPFDDGTASGTTTFDYNVEANAGWNYYGAGGELKLWYDLFFLSPYIGYGLGLQGGSFTTDITVEGDITVNLTSPTTGTETDTGTASISKKQSPDLIVQRFIVGLEFSLFLARAGFEVQAETVSKLAGVSFGVGIQF